MKATAVLGAVGYGPISETSPSRPAQPPHRWRPDAVPDHQQAAWHAGGRLGPGDPGQLDGPRTPGPWLAG
jgi:hypothetical protein